MADKKGSKKKQKEKKASPHDDIVTPQADCEKALNEAKNSDRKKTDDLPKQVIDGKKVKSDSSGSGSNEAEQPDSDNDDELPDSDDESLAGTSSADSNVQTSTVIKKKKMSGNEEAKKKTKQKVSITDDIFMLQAVLKRNPWEGARTDFTKALNEAKKNSTFFINKKEAWMYNRCTTLMTDYRNNRTGSHKSSDITDSKKRDDLLIQVSDLEWKTLKWYHSGSDSEPQPGTSVVTSTNMGEEEMADSGEGTTETNNFKFDLKKEIIVLQKVIECYHWKQGESDFDTIVDELKKDPDFEDLKITSIKNKIDDLTEAFTNQTRETRKKELQRNKLVQIVIYLKEQPKSADNQTAKDVIDTFLCTLRTEKAFKERELELLKDECESIGEIIEFAENLI